MSINKTPTGPTGEEKLGRIIEKVEKPGYEGLEDPFRQIMLNSTLVLDPNLYKEFQRHEREYVEDKFIHKAREVVDIIAGKGSPYSVESLMGALEVMEHELRMMGGGRPFIHVAFSALVAKTGYKASPPPYQMGPMAL